MRIILWPLLFALLFNNSKDQNICSINPPGGYNNRFLFTEQETDSLNAFIEQHFPDSLPGIEMLVIHKDKVLFHAVSGVSHYEKQIPLEKDMIFETGSVTKLFTALAILKLVEEGKLSLNDPLSKFFPDYPNSRKIKMKHLLSHTSGIPDYAIHFMEHNIKEHFNREQGFSKQNYFQDINRNRILEYLKNNHLPIAPGSEWEYSNGGYYYLGLIIEKISKATYFEYIKENIIKPLRLEHTTFYDPSNCPCPEYACGHYYIENPSKKRSKPYHAYYLPNEYAYSTGSLNSRLKDLYRFYQGTARGKIIHNKLLQRAWSPYKLSNEEMASTGLGWFIHEKHRRKVVCHPGCTMGFSATTHYVPQDDFFIGLYTNRNSQQFNMSSTNITLINKAFSCFYE